MMNVIERIFPKLGQYTDIPTLLPFLKPRNLLTDEEYLQLSKKWEDGYRDTTVHQLVVALKRKCPRWERELIAALEESVHPENGSMHEGHQHLLEVLKMQQMESDYVAKCPRSDREVS